MADREQQAALVARAREGDGHAFAQLVEPAKSRAWSVCLRITGQRSDAEDALQDALTAAWQNLDKFRSDAAFSTWLYRIAANAALAVVRKRRDQPTEFAELAWVTPDGTDAIDNADRIQRALADIPADFRAALVLREYGDMSYAEIAEAQGIGIQTVKSRLNRARAAVAERLIADGVGA